MANRKWRPAIAERLGLALGTVSTLRKRGMPIHDINAAERWYRENVRPYPADALAGRPPPNPPVAASSPLVELRRQKLEFEVDKARRDHAVASGRLVDRAAVDREVFRVNRGVRDRLLDVLPGQIVHELRALPSAHDAELRLRQAIRDELAFLFGWTLEPGDGE